MLPPGPFLESLSLIPGDPNVTTRTAGLAPDDNLRELLPPGIGGGGAKMTHSFFDWHWGNTWSTRRSKLMHSVTAYRKPERTLVANPSIHDDF